MYRFRMCLILLFISGTIVAALSGLNLDCTNDYENLMNCTFKAQNCSEYSLTLQKSNGNREEHLTFQECDTGLCCWSAQLIYEDYNATVWKGNQHVESKNISFLSSIKPKAPTIISVDESNGNFGLKWTTNVNSKALSELLTANVTYYKKGDTKKVSEPVKPATLDGFKYYEILGGDLEPSTTYVVSVRSYTSLSGKYSDSSEEWEFTTAASSHALRLGLVVSLSIAAVIITGAACGCYDKVRAKWVDAVAKCPKPKLLDVHPGTQKFQILKTLPTTFSSVSVDPAVPNNSKPWSEGSPEQDSEISSGPSSLSCVDVKPADIKAGVQDALSKALAQIMPMTSVNTSQLPHSDKDSGLFSASFDSCGFSPDHSNNPVSADFDNITYSIRIPSCPHLIMAGSSEAQTQAKMICDSPPLSSVTGINTIVSCDPVSSAHGGYKSFDDVVQHS